MTLSITDELKVSGKLMFDDAAKRYATDQVQTLFRVLFVTASIICGLL